MLSIPFVGSHCIASSDVVRANIRSALERGLRQVEMCAHHKHTLSIMGGGPSLADTYQDARGVLCAINKAHDFLIEHEVVPRLCCLLDPMPILAESFTPHKGVTYLVASMCDPVVFDKLEGHDVRLWHARQADQIEIEDLLPPDSLVIPGGSNAGTRMIELGDVLGFKDIHLHGFDSSFRNGSHHAYEHHDYESTDRIIVQGYETTMGLYVQVSDVARRMPVWDEMGLEITFHGDGLMQHLHAQSQTRAA